MTTEKKKKISDCFSKTMHVRRVCIRLLATIIFAIFFFLGLEDDLICKNLNALQPPDDNLPILYGRAGHGRGAGQGERKKVTSPDSGLAVISWGCFFYQKSNFIFILGCNEPIQSSVIQPDDPSSQNLKGIKARHLECTLGPSIGCMKFLFSKEFITI